MNRYENSSIGTSKISIDNNTPSVVPMSNYSVKPSGTISVDNKSTKKEKNLKTCMNGGYVSLCKHSWLTPQQAIEVKRAERRANYNSCIDGKYPSLCKHSWLTPQQVIEVKRAERREGN